MHLPQLTFVRFLAAISIVIFHFARNLYPYNSDELKFLVKQANIGVSFFYVLSGFVMIIAYSNKNEIKFFEYIKNRLARILPVYYLAILLMTLYLSKFDKPYLLSNLLLNLFTLQAWVPSKALTINFAGWSISVEMFFYVCFPFLFNYIYKFKKSIDITLSEQLSNYKSIKFISAEHNKKYILLVILALVYWIGTQFLFDTLSKSEFNKGFGTESYELLYYFPLMHLNEFILGNIGGLIFLIYFRHKKINNDIIILLFVIFSFIPYGYNTFLNPHNGLYSISFIILIIMLCINNGKIYKAFSHKSLVLLGEASYGIYILQVPVFLWSVYMLKNYNYSDPYLLFYLPLLILFIFSIFIFKYFESPMRKIIKMAHFVSTDKS